MPDIEPPPRTRAGVIAEARRWVGTRYRHQAMVRGVGVDCAGLIIGVGIACGVLRWTAQEFAPYANYSRLPNPAKMGEALGVFLSPLAGGRDAHPEDGDIAWMEWRDELPMHLAIVATVVENGEVRRTLIHASNDVGRCIEHGFADPWPDRVNSFWRYPGII